MKIFEIIPQLSSGGAERFTIDLCNELSTKHEVTLIVLHSVEKFGFYADELASNVRLVSMDKRMGFDMSLLFRLRRLIKKEKPDVVHTHLNGIVYISLSAAINR
ncbi:MAG: glycosyltransferase, partial [Mollicutes bacterium]|nr:glycosyltransferase [Mollicutes bacterium]